MKLFRKFHNSQQRFFCEPMMQPPGKIIISNNFILKYWSGRIILYCNFRLQDWTNTSEIFLKMSFLDKQGESLTDIRKVFYSCPKHFLIKKKQPQQRACTTLKMVKLLWEWWFKANIFVKSWNKSSKFGMAGNNLDEISAW